MKILYIDDEPIQRLIMEKRIKQLNHDIDFAVNGLDGINKVKKGNYDVIFMDLTMPMCDGFVATKEIRKFNKQIIIIALSSYDNDEEIKKKINDCGFDDFKEKPLRKENLIKIINTINKKINKKINK